jgi:hypothetical protein
VTVVVVELRIQLGAMCHKRKAVGCLMYLMMEKRSDIVLPGREQLEQWNDQMKQTGLMSNVSIVFAGKEQLWSCVLSW